MGWTSSFRVIGEMQEWFNWHAWRACVRETVP